MSQEKADSQEVGSLTLISYWKGRSQSEIEFTVKEMRRIHTAVSLRSICDNADDAAYFAELAERIKTAISHATHRRAANGGK